MKSKRKLISHWSDSDGTILVHTPPFHLLHGLLLHFICPTSRVGMLMPFPMLSPSEKQSELIGLWVADFFELPDGLICDPGNVKHFTRQVNARTFGNALGTAGAPAVK